ncbi:flagellar biosynthesis regulator FlaF [Candidatus Liberibacter sp.]|uniref:flagellar biosynthesis regulator FlaF n=1 Tax=Candidatus Liberibacter sp. TaxID=34022 RepID=UPI0015F638F2|nr:flagellar biosynthesis regulator FlaF [Candidatus Liberibacter sp.]MBA5723546.1 flagellar biosynthesis regulator FlaF [Candidatus Liberibacter sp.]
MRHFYDEALQESSIEARRRESLVLEKSISLLSTARHCDRNSREIIEALFYTNRVWTTFIQDLNSFENQLPKDLKINLISIGLWILKECDRIRRNESNNYQGIIDVISIIKDGLK